ncbi:MAG TPA: glycosyltransferase family 2 protein [Stellaceae bacterium]|nr:glycosyltransferase family 2 protein [Stellaceae bacterium]
MADGHFSTMLSSVEFAVFVMVSSLLLYGNLVHQLCRLGFLRRLLAHAPESREELERIYDGLAPSVAVLIPSYREEERVIRQTIFSAALVEYPNRRVVVLVDDPPSDTHGRERTCNAAAEIQDLFAQEASRLDRQLGDYLRRRREGSTVDGEGVRLARLYEELASWLERRADDFRHASIPSFAHADRLFIDRVLLAPATAHRDRAAALRHDRLDDDRIEREYRRLAALMRVEITSFERKQYANLSHEPNKAMNLNSYIGLIGRSLRAVRSRGSLWLEDCAPSAATLSIPDADYILTLDADSLVLSDYALRLVAVMEGDRRIAVAQTPYSAFPDAPSLLERVAGATTDIQYVVHQGFTRFGATYWVGANALLRLEALRDIRSVATERGIEVPVFIQDRTVIEDTGSTVDLVRKGWKLYNYPARLAFSATPPDFGSLVIQRRRWSNGGLIILPDLIRYCLSRARHRPSLAEALIRIYYLCSPAVANTALLALLLFPFDSSIGSTWLPLTAVPYYFLYGRDLRQASYRWADLLRVYALNLLLLPVNLAGVLRSLQQAATGRKAPFGRTPKIEGRTATPACYIFCHWLILAYIGAAFVVDASAARYAHAGFEFANGAFYLYGFTVFVGWREAVADLAAWRKTPATGPMARLGERVGIGPAMPETQEAPAYGAGD